jgi:putative spermidine/putrescine transport system permease protein
LFSWRWYEEFLFSKEWNDAVMRSAIVGALATALATVIGCAAAFAVARSRLPIRQAVEVLAVAPLVVPPIILAAGGYSMYVGLGMIGSNVGLALMHAVLGTPYVYLIVSAALSRADPNAELAALSLGANVWQTVRDVTVPTQLPAIMTGALFAFLISFDEVVVTLFLSGALGPTIPVRVFSSLANAASPIIAAVSTVQITIAMVLLWQLVLLRRWQQKRTHTALAMASM